jgi:Alcohol dehydrogenase GroES-like domain
MRDCPRYPNRDNRDAVIKVTACAICGSDLHIFDGMSPQMNSGDALGHYTMGEVVEIGAGLGNPRRGDRVVVPFTIACGVCFFYKKGFYSACERTNPDREKAEQLWGHSQAGLFATRISSAAILAAKLNTCESPTPMSVLSRLKTGSDEQKWKAGEYDAATADVDAPPRGCGDSQFFRQARRNRPCRRALLFGPPLRAAGGTQLPSGRGGGRRTARRPQVGVDGLASNS